MKNPPLQNINSFLERRGLWLSGNATLTLVTLIVFLGITAGFAYALHQIAEQRREAAGTGAVATRGASAMLASCAHAAVDFRPAATAGEIRQLMRAAEGFVTYGPDEFGRFQVRLSDGASGAGAQSLRGSPLVASMSTYPECP